MAARPKAGFTLIELMIVVAIIAIVAAMAIPKLSSSRISANESAAISMLRSLATAQAQVAASSAIDCDTDGAGEFAYLAELAGTAPMRIDSGGGVPAAGAVFDVLNPTILSAGLGNVDASGVVTRSGYCFRIFLPGARVGNAVPGVPENAGGGSGGAGGFPDPVNAEMYWCAYAWPANLGRSGNRAFFVNEEGDLLQTNNRIGTWDGPTDAPAFDEAYSRAGDMSSTLVNGTAGAGPAGEVWVRIQ